MKTIEADYVEEFYCDAAFCEAACCNNAVIEIDAKTLSKLKHIKPPAKSKEILKKLAKNRIIFTNSSCPFFNEETLLCSLKEEFSEEYMPQVCRRYPHKLVNLGYITVRILSITCPEASKLILGKEEPIIIVENNINSKENFNVEYRKVPNANLLTTFQRYSLEILQNKNFSPEQRLFLIKTYLENAEDSFDENGLKNYSENFIKNIEDTLKDFAEFDKKDYFEITLSFITNFYDKGGILTNSDTVGFSLFADKIFDLPKVTDPERKYDKEKMLPLFEERFIPAKDKLLKDYETEFSNFLSHLFVANLIPILPEELNCKSAAKFYLLEAYFSIFIFASVLYTLEEDFDKITVKRVASDIGKIWEDENVSRFLTQICKA